MKHIAGTSPLFLINGKAFPWPEHGFQEIRSQMVDSKRNANATVMSQIINRRQVKFNGLKWSYMSANDWRFMLNDIAGFECVVTYFDIQLNRVINRKFYFSDATATPYEFDLSNHEVAKPISFINCQVNLIDKGEVDL